MTYVIIATLIFTLLNTALLALLLIIAAANPFLTVKFISKKCKKDGEEKDQQN